MPAKAKHHIFVYGTLRPGTGPTARIFGEMYDLGWFPGIHLGGKGCNSSFVVECIEVDADKLTRIDSYEGYHEEDKVKSLYLRKPIQAVIGGTTVQGWIYVYNEEFGNHKFVESGDWLEYTGAKKGYKADFLALPKPAEEKAPEPVLDGERAAK